MPARSEPAGAVALPEFFGALDAVEIPLPGVRARILRGSVLCVSMEFDEDVEVPEHAHGGQFGIVVAGGMTVRVAGEPRRFEAGDRYEIAAGVPHAAWIDRGTILIEFFEDADRY